ncbi:MAG: condensation domain-containing protein, partial [Psychrosphaera sp.]|nr:condensation domain-containing protein [Psychrosphaera sp.]
MLRVCYIKKTANTGVLLFNMHHIASDGWSREVLTKEFFALYEAYSQGLSNPLPPLAIQYADFAHWQRAYIEGEVLNAQLDYWAQQLDELPGVHSLVLDYERPAIKTHQGAIVIGQLPSNTAKQLLLMAKAHRLTPFMLLHGALSLMLSRHSNTCDIVIGTPVANRLQGELEPLIGFFVNTLVLRADTATSSHNNNLSDYLGHIRQVHLDAQSNQDVSFEHLVERLNVPRSTAHTPLFQIMMTTDTDYGIDNDTNFDSLSLADIECTPYESDVVQAKFDLNISLKISEHGVALSWHYDTSLFSEQHIEQLNDHLCRLLEGFAKIVQGQPNQPLNTLAMLSSDEIKHLVFDLNDTAIEYPEDKGKDKCIHELFEQQVLNNPGNIAAVFESQQLTYQQLN